jgi:CTD nuclear envelope phosphatase 1
MNTLSYVARQIDGLAPTKPPSSERLQRVNTWSSKSFLFPLSSPKRSQSSPSLHQSSSSPSKPQLDAVTSTPPLPRSKHHLESVIDQIFFIRVFLMVWDHLKAAWSSVVDHVGLLTWRNAIAIDNLSSAIDKGKSKEIEQDPSTPNLDIIRSLSNSGSVLLVAQTDSSQTHTPASTSRSATPVLNAKKPPFHLVPKTLVLDLDETLIHSTSRPIPWQGSSGLLSLGSFGQRNKGAGHMVEVVLGGRSTLYHVYKRPFVDFFLRTVRLYLSKLERFTNWLNLISGFRVVYSRYFYCLNARICGSSD